MKKSLKKKRSTPSQQEVMDMLWERIDEVAKTLATIQQYTLRLSSRMKKLEKEYHSIDRIMHEWITRHEEVHHLGEGEKESALMNEKEEVGD